MLCLFHDYKMQLPLYASGKRSKLKSLKLYHSLFIENFARQYIFTALKSWPVATDSFKKVTATVCHKLRKLYIYKAIDLPSISIIIALKLQTNMMKLKWNMMEDVRKL